MGSHIAAMIAKVTVTLSSTGENGRGWVQTEGIDAGDVDDAPVWGPAGYWVRPTVGQEAMRLRDQELEDHAVGFTGNGHAPAKLSDGATEIGEGEGGLYYAGTYKVFVASDGKAYLGCDKADADADFVALAAKVLAELNDIRSKFDAHIHTTTATVGTGPVGVIAPPSPGMGAASSVAASTAKAK